MTIKSVNNEGLTVDRYLNPHFGYDIRSTLDKYSYMPTSWNNNDENYYMGLQQGFTIDTINIQGTDNFNTFSEFMTQMINDLNNNGYSSIANEFDTMQIAYPYTIVKYKGNISSVTTTQLQSGRVNVVSDNGNKYVFNNSNTYVTPYQVVNGTYNLTNISPQHPIAILNTGKESLISYQVVDDAPKEIKVSGGSYSSPYYTFTTDNDNPLSLHDGSFRFMRGRTYRFADYGISNDHPFKIHANGGDSFSISGGTDGSNYIDITIASNHSTTDGDLYYQCTRHSDMKANMYLMYRNVNESGESGNGNYDFYYGDVTLNVTGDFSKVSVYCYYHGYMGGQNIFTYSSS